MTRTQQNGVRASPPEAKNALREAIGEAVQSDSDFVMQPRKDLGGAVPQLDAPPALAIITRLRPTPSGTAILREDPSNLA